MSTDISLSFLLMIFLSSLPPAPPFAAEPPSLHPHLPKNSKINIFSAKKWRKKNVCGHARYIPAAFHTLHSLPHWEWARGKIILLKLQIFDYHGIIKFYLQKSCEHQLDGMFLKRKMYFCTVFSPHPNPRKRRSS